MGPGTASASWGLRLGVVLLFLLASPSQGLTHDGWLLLALKSQMIDAFHHLDTWNRGDPSPCAWKGVSCSSTPMPSLVSLNLSNMNLSGTVGPGIGGLADLTNLDLSFNDFSGSIPAEIGSCSKLTLLNLNNNDFQGTIPPELGKLSMLTACNLCNNKLHGPIPDEIGDMASLRDLVGYSNNLSGSIPRSIGKLRNLKTIRPEPRASRQAEPRPQHLPQIGVRSSACTALHVVPDSSFKLLQISLCPGAAAAITRGT